MKIPVILLLFTIALGTGDANMNEIAEEYVRLALAVGQHDPDYVDAYFGPASWREDMKKQQLTLKQIQEKAEKLKDRLTTLTTDLSKEESVRAISLEKEFEAMLFRVRFLGGERKSFDEESKALYDAVAPTHPESHFQKKLQQLEGVLPGNGNVSKRYDEFRKAFVIPKDKLDRLFQTAINECRRRTQQHMKLPPNENFKVEYVTDKPWSGYNWYKGNYYSVIQLNTDLPIYIDRVIDLAAHEGYPGHHIFNLLREKEMVREKNWVEFTIYPLFSPASLIAEGSANYGIEVVLPGKERVEFEKKVLFPMAGLDPSKADLYYRIHELVEELSYAGNEAARQYLNGKINAKQAQSWLENYALMSSQRASQRVRFFKKYRSYVINYNLGKDLVRKYVEARAGGDPQKRWQEFHALLSSPRPPSMLVENR